MRQQHRSGGLMEIGDNLASGRRMFTVLQDQEDDPLMFREVGSGIYRYESRQISDMCGDKYDVIVSYANPVPTLVRAGCVPQHAVPEVLAERLKAIPAAQSVVLSDQWSTWIFGNDSGIPCDFDVPPPVDVDTMEPMPMLPQDLYERSCVIASSGLTDAYLLAANRGHFGFSGRGNAEPEQVINFLATLGAFLGLQGQEGGLLPVTKVKRNRPIRESSPKKRTDPSGWKPQRTTQRSQNSPASVSDYWQPPNATFVVSRSTSKQGDENSRDEEMGAGSRRYTDKSMIVTMFQKAESTKLLRTEDVLHHARQCKTTTVVIESALFKTEEMDNITDKFWWLTHCGPALLPQELYRGHSIIMTSPQVRPEVRSLWWTLCRCAAGTYTDGLRTNIPGVAILQRENNVARAREIFEGVCERQRQLPVLSLYLTPDGLVHNLLSGKEAPSQSKSHTKWLKKYFWGDGVAAVAGIFLASVLAIVYQVSPCVVSPHLHSILPKTGAFHLIFALILSARLKDEIMFHKAIMVFLGGDATWASRDTIAHFLLTSFAGVVEAVADVNPLRAGHEECLQRQNERSRNVPDPECTSKSLIAAVLISLCYTIISTLFAYLVYRRYQGLDEPSLDYDKIMSRDRGLAVMLCGEQLPGLRSCDGRIPALAPMQAQDHKLVSPGDLAGTSGLTVTVGVRNWCPCG